MISPNVQIVLAQEYCTLFEGGSYFQPENQKFFPFYVFESWEVSKNNPVHCDYCGEIIRGNDNYSSNWFVFESSTVVKIACSRACMGDGVWEFHHQIHGQPKPLVLPEVFMPEHELVYHHFLYQKRYEILNYNGFKTWADLAKVIDTDWGGGSYKEGLFCLWEDSHLFTYSYDNGHSTKHIILSKADILRIVNELLFSFKNKQLTLF